MPCDPGTQALSGVGLGEGVVTGGQHGDEELCLLDLTGGAIDHRHGLPDKVNLHAFSGAVGLTQDHVQLAPPLPVALTELAVVETHQMNSCYSPCSQQGLV